MNRTFIARFGGALVGLGAASIAGGGESTHVAARTPPGLLVTLDVGAARDMAARGYVARLPETVVSFREAV